MLKKTISALIITVFFLMTNYSLFANTAFEGAKSAVSNSATFDGASTGYKATIPEPKLSVSQKSETKPEEPTFAEKLVQDIKDNKSTYITTLAAAGFLGFLLGGPIGILVGMGSMFAFTVVQRADYIDTYVKPKK